RLLVERRDPGHGANLGVADLTEAQGVVDQRQVAERAGHADLLAGGAQRDAAAPVQPVRAGQGALARPALLEVEAAQVGEKAMHGGVDGRGRGGDAVGERVEIVGAWGGRIHPRYLARGSDTAQAETRFWAILNAMRATVEISGPTPPEGDSILT